MQPATLPPLRRSLIIQARVVHALFLREVITRYGRHGLGVLWLILEPMMFTLGVTALWTLAKLHTVSNIPIVAFAITGYSSVLLWRNVSSRCVKAIEPNLSLMYHRNVKVLDIFIARFLLEVVGATASLVVLTLFFVGIGLMQPPLDILLVIGAWLLLSWFALALGLIVGALSERSELIERVWHVVTYLLFPLSGAVFMVHWLPVAAQEAVLWIPMVHGIEMIRHGFFGDIIPTYENAGYFAVVNMLMTLFGLALTREAGRRIQPE